MNHIFVLSINLTAIINKKEYLLWDEVYSNKCHHRQLLKKRQQQLDSLKL